MSAFQGTADRGDPNRLGRGEGSRGRQHSAEHAAGGLASKRIVVGYGFWIFLLSDIVMFSAFFATYPGLFGQKAGGPSGAEPFQRRHTGIETPRLPPTRP